MSSDGKGQGYAPHKEFVAPARESSALVQTFIGFCAIEIIYQLSVEALYVLCDTIIGLPEPGSPLDILFNLATFAGLALAVVFVVRRMHHRGPATLFGDLTRLGPDLRRATIAALGLFFVVDLLSPAGWGAEATRQPLAGWLLYLPWGLLVVLIQVTAEEIFYRGYLQQQVAARFASPVVWLVAPNLAFALVHWSNGIDTVDSLQYVLWAFCFGLAASDLVARTGGLGAAIGLHFANNIFAFLLIGVEGDLDSGLALYLMPQAVAGAGDILSVPEPALSLFFALDLSLILLAWLAIRVAIRR